VLSLTHDDLRACLATTPPVELLGMTLLKQGSPQFLPSDIPRDTLREAVTEIVAYTGRCVTAANRLRDLAPVPLTSIIFAGYGL
jgi:hypothetical protein